jgi:thiamine kinase-like enzyme
MCSDIHDSKLRSIIARIPAWADLEPIRVESIAGLTNANYRITVNGECFVLRVSRENTQSLGINRQHEALVLKTAAAMGIGPEVFAFLFPEGHLITRWVEGRHWEAEEFRTPEHIHMLIEMVKRIHAMPPCEANFSPFRRVEAYIDAAHTYAVPLPHGFNQFIETMHTVEQEQKQDGSDWHRFCHNDLVSVNYLYCESSNTIKILDWEFAGMGDIYYDLATVVYTHDNKGPIPAELEDIMLDDYFNSATPQQHRRLNGMKFMLMFFTGMWGLVQYGMQSAGLIPAVDGFDYLEFTEYLFDHDIKELQRIAGG